MYFNIIINAYNYIIDNGFRIDEISKPIERAAFDALEKRIERNEFVNGLYYAIWEMIKLVEDECNKNIKAINKRIYYWENFTLDDALWEDRVIKSRGSVSYADRRSREQEKLLDKHQIIEELKIDRNKWEYENAAFEANSISEKSNHRISYGYLLSISNVVTNLLNSCENSILIPDDVLKWLITTISKGGNGKPFIENYNGKWKWLQNNHNAWILLTHDNIRGNLSKNKAALLSSSLFLDSKNEPLKNVRPDNRLANVNTDDLLAFLDGKNKTTT